VPVQITAGRWRLVALAYAAAFLVPVVLDTVLAVSSVATEEVGSSCRVLTAAGREAFDAKVIWVQVSLVAWALAGAVLLGRAWLRRLEPSAARWTTLAGWAFGSGAGAYAAVAGPASGSLVRVLILLLYTPVVLVVSAVLMLVPLLVRRARHNLPIPNALLVASLAQLLVVLLASCVLGGSGEVEIC
jgi:hypothetical protein